MHSHRKSITAITAALILLAAVHPAFGDIISEVEPNNTIVLANPLIGHNDLGAFGTHMAQFDPFEYFSFTVDVGGHILGTFSVSTVLTGINAIGLFIKDDADNFVISASPPEDIDAFTPGQSISWGFSILNPGVYYVMIGRTGFVQPVPDLDWEFRLQAISIPGLPPAADISSGPPRAVPEPSSLVLLMSGTLLMFWTAARRLKGLGLEN